MTLLKKVTEPTLTAFLSSKEKATGTAVVILPCGGFTYVVPDLEGSEADKFLNEIRIAAFVFKLPDH